MDAIRKKMQSLKSETDSLMATIAKYESATKEPNAKLTKALAALEEKEKAFKNAEEDVSALSRRIMLMEEEAKKADSSLAETVTKLAMASKDADGILKKVKFFE